MKKPTSNVPKPVEAVRTVHVVKWRGPGWTDVALISFIFVLVSVYITYQILKAQPKPDVWATHQVAIETDGQIFRAKLPDGHYRFFISEESAKAGIASEIDDHNLQLFPKAIEWREVGPFTRQCEHKPCEHKCASPQEPSGVEWFMVTNRIERLDLTNGGMIEVDAGTLPTNLANP